MICELVTVMMIESIFQWVVTLYNLIDSHQRYTGTCQLYL